MLKSRLVTLTLAPELLPPTEQKTLKRLAEFLQMPENTALTFIVEQFLTATIQEADRHYCQISERYAKLSNGNELGAEHE